MDRFNTVPKQTYQQIVPKVLTMYQKRVIITVPKQPNETFGTIKGGTGYDNNIRIL